MGTLSITTDATQSARVAAAFGKLRGLTTPAVLNPDGSVLTPAAPRSATAAEIKQEVVNYLKGVVQDQEAAAAKAALAAPADLIAT
jgi:hypothetical protein